MGLSVAPQLPGHPGPLGTCRAWRCQAAPMLPALACSPPTSRPAQGSPSSPLSPHQPCSQPWQPGDLPEPTPDLSLCTLTLPAAAHPVGPSARWPWDPPLRPHNPSPRSLPNPSRTGPPWGSKLRSLVPGGLSPSVRASAQRPSRASPVPRGSACSHWSSSCGLGRAGTVSLALMTSTCPGGGAGVRGSGACCCLGHPLAPAPPPPQAWPLLGGICREEGGGGRGTGGTRQG